MNHFVEIAGKKIGKAFAPYIVAELSANHCGSLDTALKAIEIAKESGADAIKLQTYTADSMTINCDKSDFKIKGGLWHGYSLHELYEKAHTPLEWHQALFNKAKEVGITLFSTAFDESAVDFLVKLDTPAFKIASFELTDLSLIKYIAKTGKPMIMSTGMANLSEIEEAVCTAKKSGCEDIILLHCISSYPAPIDQSNLKTLNDLSKRFGLVVGLSDHSLSNNVSVAAVALGASFVEKHFILNKDNNSPDSDFSIEPEDLKNLCLSTKEAWQALGQINYKQTAAELDNVKFRRSIYFVADVKSGEYITKQHIRRIRPGFGLAPKYFEQLIGRKASCDIDAGTPVSWHLLEKN
ncbi:pseudaminic acid synthase [Pseudoalteromonas denitrificans]|uniref:N-acetylneuraminate synthase n=1 Tax=Pseudoalteromonas denitrificans DSM 6059 TaxID=1123010 RepID=A0A1I1HLG7_9GAMM|nr:pseudaminic acid synthase [Pseudoalteromonas denitrificans]SFC24412.1 N-acetylneuraminate synthase [Pseudoalteromonas denitrificans DSM 6059]